MKEQHWLRRILPYVRPYAPLIFVAVIVSLIEIAGDAAIPRITQRIIDGPIAQRHPEKLIPLGLALVVIAAVISTMARLRRMWLARGSHGMETDLRDHLYRHLQKLHVSFHDTWQSGQLLSRAIYDINSIRRFVGFAAPFMVILTVQFVVVVGLMFSLDPLLAAIVAVGVLPVGVVSYFYGRAYRGISRKVQDQQGDLTTTIEEAATGIRIIKAFGRGPQVLKNFRKQARELQDTNLRRVRLDSRLWPMFEFSPNLLLVGILTIGGLAVMKSTGRFTLGELVAFIQYLNMLVWPVDALGWILAMTVESRTATERVFEVMDTEPEIHDREGAVSIPSAKGRIKFENVSFRYSKERDWVVRGVDLEIAPGETLALVGKTGCGKTSLAMLVPRLYEVTEGRITLDGNDVAELTLDSLRATMGVAFEDPILFSASVRDNLVMGRPEASDEEIRSALETAQAEFVYDLPWGLDTRVGEQGYTLSGGQRQRLALARAVLGEPQVLVLDDPLSSVDVHTEALIEDALRSVLHGVTAILVVHRPSTLALADRVALLDEGSIVAVGTHHDLMDSHPLYRSILSQQAEEMVS
jgi:ATP-binding cassette subfamily B protein